MEGNIENPSEFINFTTVLVFLCTFFLAYVSTRRRDHVPPGPPLFPIIGNLPSLMTKDTLGRLAELRKNYGDVFGLYMGKKLIVFLNGYEAVHDALVKKGFVFKNRGKPADGPDSVYNTKGLIFSTGSLWKDGRNFALEALQEICFSNKQFVENVIDDEVTHLADMVLDKNDAFDIERILNSSGLNVTFRIVFGHRFDLEDSWLIWVQKAVRDFSEYYVQNEVLLNCLPALSYIPGDLLGMKKNEIKMVSIMQKFTELIDDVKHNKNTEVRNQTRCFVSVYLERIAIETERGVIDSTFDEENLKVTAYNLIIAGSETTATTIRWILLYLIRNPHIQDKMYDEMCRVIGHDTPCIADRKRLPYVQAVVLEGLRISCVAPLALPHTVHEDVEFRGYLIPKNSTVMPNLNSVMMDPQLWPNPTEFRPERFLNEDCTEVVVPKQFVVFSLGPRSCIGESLARIEIFLYIAGLTQKMRLLPEKEGILPKVEGVMATTFVPTPYKMRVNKR